MKDIISDLKVLGKDIYRNLLKYPLQRLFKGYCDEDLWGLDAYVVRRTLPALKAFRKKKICGYPSDFKNMKEWLKTIDKMIYALENLDSDYLPKKWKDVKEGLELLGKYLQSLWD